MVRAFLLITCIATLWASLAARDFALAYDGVWGMTDEEEKMDLIFGGGVPERKYEPARKQYDASEAIRQRSRDGAQNQILDYIR